MGEWTKRARGYVIFTVEEGAPERLMDLCARHGVPLWDAAWRGDRFFGRTTPDGYRRIRSLARKADFRTKVRKRRGLPFVVWRYRKRRGILIGAILFLALLIASQQFIWVVRVEGCETVDPLVVKQALDRLGVRPGTLKAQVDTRKIRVEIPLMIKDLSWSALNLQGTTATLQVRERTKPPQKIDVDTPANVVASMDGQIIRLEVTDGKAMRKVGDTVRKGELIASGIVEDRWGLTHLVRANASALAKVPQTLTVEVPLFQEELRVTGEVSHRRWLEVGGLRIPLFLQSKLEGDYKLERFTQPVKLLGMELPLELTKESYLFYQRDQQEISEESALRIAQIRLSAQEREMFGEKMLSSQYTAETENGILTLRGDYVVEMDIAQQVEIPVFDWGKSEKPPREGGY